MSTKLATILLLLHGVGALNGSDSCNPGWLSHGSSCFRVYDGKMNYTASRDQCKSFNAGIANPKDQATNDSFVQLRNSVKRTLNVWIGLTYIAEEDRWVWEDGEDLEQGAFNNWADNEPNNYYWRGGDWFSRADCAYVRRDNANTHRNKWGDYSCTQGRFGVICEKEWCEFPRTARVCENRTLSLRCPIGQRIDIISAMYGRTCRFARVCGGPARNSTCNSTNSFKEVTKFCHGKESCSVSASNSVFGDPCPDTLKYLDVVYACTDGEKRTPPCLVGVVCAAVVVLVIIAVVTVLFCRRKHNPCTNVPGKSGNEMKNVDTPERHNHTASEGTVDNVIYNTEGEGFVDNVIYQGEDSRSNNQENAREPQYESVN
ncbi:uncharacterized protein LOC144912263 [Branchiostoma floridae x Branchiostoma belcheri]